MSAKASVFHEHENGARAVAFTFDDGPHPVYTPQFADLFSRYGGRATFFMLGVNVEQYPETVRQIAEAGHEIGNHTYSHPHLPQISDAEIRSEVERTSAVIEQSSGRKPALFRPPYLDVDERVIQLVAEQGYPLIHGFSIEDWDSPGVEAISSAIRENIRSGSIIVGHDGCGNQAETLLALEQMLEELQAQGYRLVTVSELLTLS